MKKTVYIQPKAETVLLHEDDVIRVSLTTITDEISIDAVPKTGWRS